MLRGPPAAFLNVTGVEISHGEAAALGVSDLFSHACRDAVAGSDVDLGAGFKEPQAHVDSGLSHRGAGV